MLAALWRIKRVDGLTTPTAHPAALLIVLSAVVLLSPSNMKLSTLSLLSFAHFLSSVLAAPTPADVSDLAPRNETVAKRAGGEINYLADCRRVDYDDNADYPASYMAWYSDIDWSNNYYHIPDALSSEYRDWANGGKDWFSSPESVYCTVCFVD